jgi:hypothetical protein
MLDRDEGSEVPAASRSVKVSPQFFDGEQRLGEALARSHGLTEPVWDAFYFYAPGAAWPPDAMPIAEASFAQVAGIVAGAPGTLPALPDQSRLPPELAGKAVVIGAQRDIEDIMRRVARPFAARHRP